MDFSYIFVFLLLLVKYFSSFGLSTHRETFTQMKFAGKVQCISQWCLTRMQNNKPAPVLFHACFFYTGFTACFINLLM